ncbi:tryptophan synthase subunit alpha [Desulfoprunum benzoelyticum]|uniref:Tryptophan synthase alpha chain n=1 Tax=Desulfoprunum benzoelyticum TaxID=1506996 RepID=A0A840UT91_9BACT|nr:tryptophan synthase subunit alpha [Desulfoprunum benzoelyticum]MBB5349012.1 tryptophan synthase alpha chain [Desulfoprunum benzoelyticum]MBM9530505.1 tryptophan synthase subunit alpha [Desulfoprunum benzoelyticum]
MQLEETLKKRRKEKDILLMTHLVLGYPSFEVNRRIIRQMVDNGVDCIEMQIPFSEPMADGPVILKANQDSLAAGTTVAACLEFGREMAASYDIPFLFMTYYNIVFKYGEERFLEAAKAAGITGLIIPDLPPEMGGEFMTMARDREIAPILIIAPTSTDERMAELNGWADGFIYCAARRGVTGKKSEFGSEFYEYLARCRRATSLPLAVGFGIQNRDDVAALIGRADMAVIGSRTIRLVDEEGPEAVGPFIASLR